MTTLTLAKALNAGLRRALADDEKVVLMGEDIGTLGGVFRVTDGLKAEFGAKRVVDSLGLSEEIPVAGLAKEFERVYVPGRSEPVELARGSEALFMLQRIRDEAHRFANTFHRERRSKRMTKSALDDIPGLGETRKNRLMKELGGVNAVKRADLADLKDLSWLPDPVADAIYAKFHP